MNNYKYYLSYIIGIIANAFTSGVLLAFYVRKNFELEQSTNFFALFLLYSAGAFVFYLLYYYLESIAVGYKRTKQSRFEINLFFLILNFLFLVNILLGSKNLLTPLAIFIIIVTRVILFRVLFEGDFRKFLKVFWRDRLRYFLVILLFYSLAIAILYFHHKRFNFIELIWEKADSRVYKSLSDTLLLLRPNESPFTLGTSIMMSPFNLLRGTFISGEINYNNYLNNILMFLFAFVITPVGIFLLVKSAVKNIPTSRKFLVFTLFSAISVAIITLYLLFIPRYSEISAGDIEKLWLRVLGFVPSVEPLIIFGCAALIYILAYWKDKKFNPYIIGFFGGLFLLVKETNFAIWGLFLLIVLWETRKLSWSFKALIISLGVYSLQLLYNFLNFGNALFSNRSVQDEVIENRYIKYVARTYDLSLDKTPRLSLQYLPNNIVEIVSFYIVPIVLLTLLAFILYKKRSFNKKLISFCYLNIIFSILFYSCYIRVAANTRYLSVLLPFVIYLILLGVILILKKFKLSKKSTVHLKSKTNMTIARYKNTLKKFLPIAICILFLLQGLILIAKLPQGIIPDENTHVELINDIYTHGTISPGGLTYFHVGGTGGYPFLYHTLMAVSLNFNFPLFGIDDYTFLRLMNLMLGLLTVIFIYKLALYVTKSRKISVVSTFLASVVSIFIFISSGVNYDNLTNLLSIVTIFYFFKFLDTKKFYNFCAFLSFGLLGSITKITFAPLFFILLVIIAIALFKKTFRQALIKDTFPLNIKRILVASIVLFLVLINSWVFIGNFIKYKNIDPSCSQVYSHEQCFEKNPIYNRNYNLAQDLARVNAPRAPIYQYFASWQDKILNRTFGILGHKVVITNPILVLTFYILLIISLSSYLYLKKRPSLIDFMPLIFLAYTMSVFVYNYKDFLIYNTFDLGVQGRYILPTFPLILIFIVYSLFRVKGRKLRWLMLLVIILLFTLLSFPYIYLKLPR